ncbi:MAG: cytochrome c-type biogenesis protein CcmH [Legionella sp.]|jgi:cytochrome c-type biogenesis protein CcmH|nr:cytochrome c-type biogenesis protein CcmH [Legionella sp.]
MKRIFLSGLCIILCVFLSQALYADAIYPFDTQKKHAQFRGLLRDLRCLVCQNQDLADSNAGLARDLRDEVYAHVQAGESDDEIMRYLTMRYGDFILFKPPVKAVTSMLWFGPALFLAIGLFLFLRKTRHA